MNTSRQTPSERKAELVQKILSIGTIVSNSKQCYDRFMEDNKGEIELPYTEDDYIMCQLETLVEEIEVYSADTNQILRTGLHNCAPVPPKKKYTLTEEGRAALKYLNDTVAKGNQRDLDLEQTMMHKLLDSVNAGHDIEACEQKVIDLAVDDYGFLE